MRTALARALFAAVLVLGAGTARAATLTSEFSEKAETLIAQYIDDARAAAAPGAPRLATDPELTRIARARSDALAHDAPFAHDDGHGNYPAIDMVKARFGPYGFIGENIALETSVARGFDPAGFARRTVDGWMGSEEHRENIVLPDYTSSGIGVVVIGDLAFATQVFRGPPPPAKRAAPARPRGAVGEWSPQGGF